MAWWCFTKYAYLQGEGWEAVLVVHQSSYMKAYCKTMAEYCTSGMIFLQQYREEEVPCVGAYRKLACQCGSQLICRSCCCG